MSPDAISGAPKCSEMRFRPGLCPGPRRRSSQRSHNTYQVHWEPNCKGKEKDRRIKGEKDRRCRQKGKQREGIEKEGDGVALKNFLQGAQNLKLHYWAKVKYSVKLMPQNCS